MSEQPHVDAGIGEPTPAGVALLLDVVAAHGVEPVLAEMEQVIARVRAGEAEAAEARSRLRDVPAPLLREALLLRAARAETLR